MPVLKHIATVEGAHYGFQFLCPGCGVVHAIPTLPYADGWSFDGNEERPSFGPSIVFEERRRADGSTLSPRCHAVITAGRIAFLADCGHALAGQTTDLPQIDGFSSNEPPTNPT